MEPGSHEDARPTLVTAVAGALGFVGATAMAGGIEMVLFPHGNRFVKAEWIDEVPLIQSWRLPGVVLGIGLGVGSSVTAFGLLRRPRWRWLAPVERRTGRHWSWAATIAAGLGLGGWILLEVAWIPQRSPIEALYGGIAVLVLAASRTPSMREHLAQPTEPHLAPAGAQQ